MVDPTSTTSPGAAYGSPPPYAPYPYPGTPTPSYGYGGPTLATWGRRALGGLIDYVAPSVLASTITNAATNSPTAGVVATVMGLAQFAWWGYNSVYLGGTTGYSWGRRLARVRLVSAQTGQPIGVGLALVRQLAHAVDSLLCMIGWLFPLWDAKRQTLADKMVSTVVIDTPGI